MTPSKKQDETGMRSAQNGRADAIPYQSHCEHYLALLLYCTLPQPDHRAPHQTLIKISANIIENPSEPKYRTIKETNNSLKNKVLLIKGGPDYLIAVGLPSCICLPRIPHLLQKLG